MGSLILYISAILSLSAIFSIFQGVYFLTNNTSNNTTIQKSEIDCFNVDEKNKNATITWTAIHEAANSFFILEKSINGSNFATIKTIKPKGIYNSGSKYIFHDFNLNEGTYLYRVSEITNEDDQIHHCMYSLNISDNLKHCLIMEDSLMCNGKCLLNLKKCNHSEAKDKGILLVDAFGNQVFTFLNTITEEKIQIHSDKQNILKPAVIIVRNYSKKKQI